MTKTNEAWVSIERELNDRTSREGARFRAKLHLALDGHALFNGRKCGSVAAAKRDAEALFGALNWLEPATGWRPETRAVAKLWT